MHPTVVHAMGLPGGKVLLTERTHNTLVMDMLRFHMIHHILPLLGRVIAFATLNSKFEQNDHNCNKNNCHYS